MQTKNLHKTGSNLLNNQNYILGNSEKKKVLSKFFVEKMIDKIMFIFSITNSFFYNKKYEYKSDKDKYNIFFIFVLYI